MVLKGSCFPMSYLALCIGPPFDIILAKNSHVPWGAIFSLPWPESSQRDLPNCARLCGIMEAKGAVEYSNI